MILTDFLPIKFGCKGTTSASLNQYQELLRLHKESKGRPRDVREAQTKELEALRITMVMDDGYAIPNTGPYETSYSLTDKIRDQGRIRLHDLRDAADALRLTVMPYAFFDKAYLPNATDRTRSLVERFVRVLGDHFQVYVLAPFECYSVDQHLASDADTLPMYANPSMAGAFTAIITMIPLLRHMMREIKRLDARYDLLGRALVVQNTSMAELLRNTASDREEAAAMHREMERLKQSVQDNARAAGERHRELVEQFDRFRRYTDRDFSAVYHRVNALTPRKEASSCSGGIPDPLMIAVPKHRSVLYGDGSAVVGPCWGEEISDALLATLGYTKQEGQRETVAERARYL